MRKTALVTGGSRGIGLQVVKELCCQNINTIFTSRNPHDGMTVFGTLKEHKQYITYHPLEVSDNASVEDLFKFVSAKFPRLDILINNAGTNYDSWQRASSVAMAEVEYTISVNLLGPWRMCNAFIPLLRKSKDGRIINVSSGSGSFDSINGSTPAYSLSKNALNMLTRSLAADLRETSITVNSVCPGWTRTDMGGPNAPRSVLKGAESIVWLATRAQNSTTGEFFRDKKTICW